MKGNGNYYRPEPKGKTNEWRSTRLDFRGEKEIKTFQLLTLFVIPIFEAQMFSNPRNLVGFPQN